MCPEFFVVGTSYKEESTFFVTYRHIIISSSHVYNNQALVLGSVVAFRSLLACCQSSALCSTQIIFLIPSLFTSLF